MDSGARLPQDWEPPGEVHGGLVIDEPDGTQSLMRLWVADLPFPTPGLGARRAIGLFGPSGAPVPAFSGLVVSPPPEEGVEVKVMASCNPLGQMVFSQPRHTMN